MQYIFQSFLGNLGLPKVRQGIGFVLLQLSENEKCEI